MVSGENGWGGRRRERPVVLWLLRLCAQMQMQTLAMAGMTAPFGLGRHPGVDGAAVVTTTPAAGGGGAAPHGGAPPQAGADGKA